MPYLFESQEKGGDIKYVEKVRRLIKGKAEEIKDKWGFEGQGRCSEYRNSIKPQYEKFTKIIKEK